MHDEKVKPTESDFMSVCIPTKIPKVVDKAKPHECLCCGGTEMKDWCQRCHEIRKAYRRNHGKYRRVCAKCFRELEGRAPRRSEGEI